MQDIVERIHSIIGYSTIYTKDEIEQAASRLQIRYLQILKAPNDPLNFVNTLETAILKIKAEDAEMEGNRDLAQGLSNIFAHAKTATPPDGLSDGRILINRIGFTIHTPELFNHYKNIFNILGRDQFAVVLYDQALSLVPLLDDLHISYISIHDIKLKKFVFKYLVSNHVIAQGDSGRWIIQEIGLKNIRFMYALGKSRWNFSDWNCVYDLVLCFGPYQVKKLSFCENTKKLEIGYPRYDEFFKGNIDKDFWLKKLNCDPAKKTIVWLPTKGELSSVKAFSSIIAALTSQYNVVVKPHPLALEEDVQDIELLKQQNFNAVVDELIDNTNLFYVADYIFSDYGGTAFGAIYTDRNLVLLNLPEPENDQLTGIDSADIGLRQSIINVDPENGGGLTAILSDPKVWEDQMQIREQLRNIYFAPYYGNAAEMTVSILENLDNILGNKEWNL